MLLFRETQPEPKSSHSTLLHARGHEDDLRAITRNSINLKKEKHGFGT